MTDEVKKDENNTNLDSFDWVFGCNTFFIKRLHIPHAA